MFNKVKMLSVALLFPVLAAAYTPQKEALLVGVGEYQSGMGMMNLDGVDKDILRMKKLLEERGFHVRVLFNSEATLDNVRRALRSYQNLSSSDSFFYYESSHGTQVPDMNGDEEDAKDEAFVLYDAEFGNSGIMNSSGLLIDDELESMLSDIQARKVMFADACHSGTMYKGLNSRLKSKTVRLSPDYRGKGILGPVRKPKNLVTLSASGDREQSLASPQGSLFTSAVYDAWSSRPDITFQNMERLTTKHIENRCMQERNGGGDAPVFHPALYATNSQFEAEPIDQYLQVNITINQETNLAEDYLDSLMADGEVGSLAVKNKAYYENGEHIFFDIDTLGKQGHLYILTIPSGENVIDVLYPNPYYQNSAETWRGRFSFPPKNNGFEFQASNTTSGTQRTVVYVILSESIIPELEVSRKSGYKHFQSIAKDFGGQSSLKNSVKNILVQRKANGISIAKQVFSVGK